MIGGFKEKIPLAGSHHESFEARVVAVRHRAGLTVQEFAERIGARVTKGGSLDLRKVTCEQIARAFNVNAMWIYAGSVAPKRFWPDWWTPPDAQSKLETAYPLGEATPRTG